MQSFKLYIPRNDDLTVLKKLFSTINMQILSRSITLVFIIIFVKLLAIIFITTETMMVNKVIINYDIY